MYLTLTFPLDREHHYVVFGLLGGVAADLNPNVGSEGL